MAEETGTEKAVSETTQVSDWAGEYIREIDAAQYLPDSVIPFWDLLLQYPLLLLLFLLPCILRC